MKPTPPYWRLGHLVVLLAALAAGIAGLAILFSTLHRAEALTADEARRHYLAWLSVVSGLLLIFAIFCLGVLAIRLISLRFKPGRAQPGRTDYVDAWKIAGQRVQVPKEDTDTPDEDRGAKR